MLLQATKCSQAEFLTLSRAFEDTGVSAYAGAATLLSGNNLQAAAQILAVEAYYAGNIRLNVVQQGITVPATDSQDVPPDVVRPLHKCKLRTWLERRSLNARRSCATGEGWNISPSCGTP